jgi:predicted SAM-dependent methyltransferase
MPMNITINPLLLTRRLISTSKAKRILHTRKNIFLELGSGNKKGRNGWTTIDMKRNCDLYWDLRWGIPFPDNTVEKIYSSHFFEHLTFKEGQKFLRECMRVLAPGATFSICVPNARLYIEKYMDPNLHPELNFAYSPAHNNTTAIDWINYTAYMDGHHKYMFDEENLITILHNAGLDNPRLREFDESIDMMERDYESIYAVGEKRQAN